MKTCVCDANSPVCQYEILQALSTLILISALIRRSDNKESEGLVGAADGIWECDLGMGHCTISDPMH